MVKVGERETFQRMCSPIKDETVMEYVGHVDALNVFTSWFKGDIGHVNTLNVFTSWFKGDVGHVNTLNVFTS